MKSIGIIGANGHVGSEVCLYLSMFDDVQVVPICRSTIASAFLRRLGLPCRHGSLSNAEEASELLKGLDLIADFTMPVGTVSQILKTYRKYIPSLAKAAPAGAKLVFTSTIMAYGPGETSKNLRHHVLARTAYGFTKRCAERLFRRSGRKTNHQTWILRLGIVYGALQPSSMGITEAITDRPVAVPDGPSYTIFCFTVAEALANIVKGRETPGKYTLVSVPPYSWEEAYRYHANLRGIRPDVVVRSHGAPDNVFARMGRFALGWCMAKLRRHREMLSSYVLSKIPHFESSARASHLVKSANLDIALFKSQPVVFDVFDCPTIPGRHLKNLSDPRVAMQAYEEKLRTRLTAYWGSLGNSET